MLSLLPLALSVAPPALPDQWSAAISIRKMNQVREHPLHVETFRGAVLTDYPKRGRLAGRLITASQDLNFTSVSRFDEATAESPGNYYRWMADGFCCTKPEATPAGKPTPMVAVQVGCDDPRHHPAPAVHRVSPLTLCLRSSARSMPRMRAP